MILADPTKEVLSKQLPPLVREGHSSIKVFMTYDRLRIDDEQLLDVLSAARENSAFVMVHAENHGMIDWMAKRLLARDRKSTRLNSSHQIISYAVFCLKKKK